VRLTAFVAVLTFAPLGHADENAECGASYQKAQREKMAGHFRAARAELLVCAKPACPKFISSDCTGWLAEIEQQLPTIVLAAIDENGKDLAGAELAVDGETVPNDGLPHAFDPGTHAIELRAGARRVEQSVTLRTGEKARRVELRFAPTAATPERVRRPVPASAFVFGGFALAFIATSGIFWGIGTSDANAYNARCAAGPCTSAEHDTVLRELVVGDVALGLAVTSAVIATVLVLTRKTIHEPVTLAIRF
jgi:hypothetical protein